MEQPALREAVAVFDDAEKLEGAVSELQSNGIDRSELSFSFLSLSRRTYAARSAAGRGRSGDTARAGSQRYGRAAGARTRD
jgi:hypothetical protein